VGSRYRKPLCLLNSATFPHRGTAQPIRLKVRWDTRGRCACASRRCPQPSVAEDASSTVATLEGHRFAGGSLNSFARSVFFDLFTCLHKSKPGQRNSTAAGSRSLGCAVNLAKGNDDRTKKRTLYGEKILFRAFALGVSASIATAECVWQIPKSPETSKSNCYRIP
jgi:hypothetical protein